MVYKNTFLAMCVVAASLSQKEQCQASAAAVRGLKKSPTRLLKGSKSSKKGPKSSKKASKKSSSREDPSKLCSLEVSGFDPYRRHMKYSKDVEFFVQLSGVPNSRRLRKVATNQAKMSLQDGLVKHFEKRSFQRQIDDSNLLQSFEFDPSVDLEVRGAGYSRHSDDEDETFSLSFPSPLFSGTIEYFCSDYEDDEELFWELARILDSQISSSETPLYRKFSKDFQNLNWDFEDIRLMVSMA